jgi:circadian clock protein KaiC
MTEFQKLSCGIPGLDEILGGFVTPSTVLVAGTAGVGKTTMSLHILSNATKNGEKTLYVPITTESSEKFQDYVSTLKFYDDSIEIHEINRQNAEKDPLSTLIDIGNVVSSANPDRIVIDPITPLGFGFVEQEKRRFFYTLDSMIQEWNALVILTGELFEDEIHKTVISHLADGIIYLFREEVGFRTDKYLKIIKMRGIDPQIKSNYSSQKYHYDVSSEGFKIYPRLKPDEDTEFEDTKIESGIKGFDPLLGDGIPKASSVLIEGEPGTGKTIFSLQYIMKGLINGEPCIIVTYEEIPQQIILEASKFGWDLQSYIDEGLLKFIYTNPVDVHPAKHESFIKSNVEEMGAKRIVFDGIVNMEMTIQDPIKLRGHFQAVINYLKSKNVTSIFTTEILPGKEEITTSHDASFIMDVVVVMEYTKSAELIKNNLHIMKSRRTNHDPRLKEYQITDSGIEILNNSGK